MMGKTIKPIMVSENSALSVSTMKGLSTEVGTRIVSQRKKFDEKGRWCDFSNNLRHAKETCWKLHGKALNWKAIKPAKRTRGMQTLTDSQSSIEPSPFSEEQLEHLYKLMNQSSQNPLCTLSYKGFLPRALSIVSFYTPWIIHSGTSNHMTSQF